MSKPVPYKSIAAFAVMLFMLVAGVGCRPTKGIDLLSMDLEDYQPIDEFVEAYDNLSSQEQQQSDAPYDLEQTIRVINAMELAQMHAESFDDFLDYMASQDYTGVAPDVLEAKRKLFPLLEYTYKLQQQDEKLSNIWMLMRSVARGSENLMGDTSLVELIMMMHSDIFALFHLASGGDVQKSLDEAFEQYEKDNKLKAQIREDLDRLRERLLGPLWRQGRRSTGTHPKHTRQISQQRRGHAPAVDGTHPRKRFRGPTQAQHQHERH